MFQSVTFILYLSSCLVILPTVVYSVNEEENSLPYFCEDLLFLAGAVENDRASSSLLILVFFLSSSRCSSIVGIEDRLPTLSHINLHDFHFA